MNSPGVPFFRRQKVREIAVILAVLLFFGAYRFVSPIRGIVDAVVDPAVAGITVAYGSASGLIKRFTGLDLGLIPEETDQEFLFAVRLATYINERQAGPLLELATDPRISTDKRERALRALLKFQSTSDWVQPFLNELPKGGMLSLYDKKTPVLDELIKKIRAEGGLRQPLVRAYAEVVFSFMMQVPDAVIRSHSLRWVSDVIAEDALFLIVPRIAREDDPEIQAAIEGAIMDVRAVSDPDSAREMLLPFYKKPPWPSLRFPLSVALTRLGYQPASEYLSYVMKNENLSEAEKIAVRVALAKTRYPRELRITEQEEKLVARRAADRQAQLRLAMEKRERMIQQERMKRAMLARRANVDPAPAEPAVETRDAAPQAPVEEARVAPVAPERTAEPAPVVKTAPARDTAAAEQAERLAAIERRRAVEEAEAVARAEQEAAAERASREQASREQASREQAAPEQASRERAAAPVAAERIVTEALVPEAPAARAAAPREERAPPKGFGVPGELSPEERRASKTRDAEQLARLPDDVLPPPLEETTARKPRSLMNYVDVVFEVKQEAPVYQNPGEKKAGRVTLPVGTKGKAGFEVMIGEERWYQVKTKKGNGWVEASRLSAFNLSPGDVVPAAPAAAARPAGDPMDGDRSESTYFEPTTEDVPVYAKSSERSKVVGNLKMGTVYLAVKSEKVGPNRWFLLQLRAGETGWVLGDINLQLANVVQPSRMEIPGNAMRLRNREPWFAAGWVTPGVKGVGVYARSSMGSELLLTVDPGQVFRVVETNEGGGAEWYRIQLSGKKLGWVQAMDVKITKEPE